MVCQDAQYHQSQSQNQKIYLDDYSHAVWFGVHHDTTWIIWKVVNLDTFCMHALPYILSKEVLHNEVLSWKIIIGEVRYNK